MTEGQFFEALLLALRLEGLQYVDTRGGAHYRALDAALETLADLQANGHPGATTMPATIFPAPVTGSYEQFDEALLNVQDFGISSALNPFYDNVALVVAPERAAEVLESYADEERAVLTALASAFRRAMPQRSTHRLA